MLKRTLLRGEIWLINLDPAIGAEIQKMRPAIVVNKVAMGVLPLRIIVPLTEWKDRYSIAPKRSLLELHDGLIGLSTASDSGKADGRDSFANQNQCQLGCPVPPVRSRCPLQTVWGGFRLTYAFASVSICAHTSS